MNETAIRDLTDTAADIVGQIIPDCEGACLGTSAILAYVLRNHGVKTIAVRGSYNGNAHWWLETDGLRIDATRSQFRDGLPLVESPCHGRRRDPYVAERGFPSKWDREQAVAEFTRMFEFTNEGDAHGRRVLADLEAAAPALAGLAEGSKP